MLHINPNSVKIIKARKKFYKDMSVFISKRIKWIRKIKDVNTRSIERFFHEEIIPSLDEILIGSPSTLLSKSKRINSLIIAEPDLKKGINYVFNYDLFISKTSRYDAYNLAQSLDITTCPYCNRNYTNTVIKNNGKKVTRPQFDHYFDKGTHPLLALSFYNLIPSCSICNSSIKGTQKMNLDEYLHPYIDNSINDIHFTYRYSSDTPSGLKIKVNTPINSKAKKTIEAFAIEQVYNSHTGELLDMLKTRQYFSDRYLTILRSNLLKHVIISNEELYRIVFGTELNSIKFVKRPFSKFKKDILEELGII